ncbi:hypothetical protein B0T25DRAFT_527648 [Lasiosphaeria hispida]|uniref:Uncharacterized protein n=1 Tax=Lasiosphaeria hispida TaxID=260671 RepID=A0AAJ0H4P0_9PEZI|nr:hypothetical protein B0T25DRAFT_561225 [Lasiosphaeria hispida]KAK3363477.1 hypothetical protein B0T25DRAFT_527648 [Lasiosphaeria hispida]
MRCWGKGISRPDVDQRAGPLLLQKDRQADTALCKISICRQHTTLFALQVFFWVFFSVTLILTSSGEDEAGKLRDSCRLAGPDWLASRMTQRGNNERKICARGGIRSRRSRPRIPAHGSLEMRSACVLLPICHIHRCCNMMPNEMLWHLACYH